MPELSRFLGIIIAMYYRDHSPPHFHAVYGDDEISVDILTGGVRGDMPTRALAAVQEWRLLNQNSLDKAWQCAREGQPLPRIPPLE